MKKAHVIGVSGVAMSAMAKLLQDEGYEVSGSDSNFYPPASDYVEKLGIKFNQNYKAENIPEDANIIVIGRTAQLDPETNPEVQAALKSTAEIYSYPKLLAKLTKNRTRVVVAGSYGKSTVTSLIIHILRYTGLDIGYMVGAYPLDLEYTSAMGTHKLFIIEGDEYPTAHGDQTSKFLYYNPEDVILTSVDHDHVNIFPTYESYKEPFVKLLQSIPSNGLLTACTDNTGVNEIGHSCKAQITTYGIEGGAIWSTHNIKLGDTTTFDIRKDGAQITTIETTLLGMHNVQNILGASAYVLERGFVTPEQLSEAILKFNGVSRRLNRLTNQNSLPTYEGFGSSYEKARSAIEAVVAHYPRRELVILFEPHTFSWRNKDALFWYDDVFKEASTVLVFHPATQGANTHKQLSQKEIVDRINASGSMALAINSEQEIFKELEGVLTKNSALLILTSGDLDGALSKIPAYINNNY